MRRFALLLSSTLFAAGTFVIGFHLGIAVAHVADAADSGDSAHKDESEHRDEHGNGDEQERGHEQGQRSGAEGDRP